MDREEKIEKLCDIIESNIDIDILESSADNVDYNLVGVKNAAKEIANMMDDMCKKTVKEILQYLFDPDCYGDLSDVCEYDGWAFTASQKDRVFEKFGVEVDE